MPKYLWGIFAVTLLLCGIMGILDGAMTSLHTGQTLNVSGIPRLFNPPALIIAGFFYDYKKGRYFPLASMISMMILVFSVFLLNGADSYNTALGIYYFFGAVGSVYSISALTVEASSSSNPALWASMGRVAKYVFNGVMSVVGSLLFAAGSMFVYLGVFIVLMVLLLLFFVWQGKLNINSREPAAAPPAPPDFSVYGFTPRELEILQKVLASEKSVKELAEELFISERVLYRHLDSIYKKTGTASRMGLVLKFLAENWSFCQWA